MTEKATTHKVGIIMNGVTGRMGTNQHLFRSIHAIRKAGGIRVGETDIIFPEPTLVGRNPEKLKALSEKSGISQWSTNLREVLDDPGNTVYFDALTTDLRYQNVKMAIEAGKHIYCEKPVAGTTGEALQLYRLAHSAGVKHGVVQDKLWLPGIQKLKALIDEGFFGRLLSVRGNFGYWVFDGETVPAQRPSWNYRKEDGGGIILDMLCHWRYVLDNLFGEVKSVYCLGTTHIPRRRDEQNQPYPCTADDACYAVFQLEDGIIAQFNSSWVTRVRRDDLLTIQVDGTDGSAVAGLRNCWIQAATSTPRPVWNPDEENKYNFFNDWQAYQGDAAYDNAFKIQWELFLKHIVFDTPFSWTLLEGAKGVQLAEKGYESWESNAVVEIPAIL